MLSTAVQDFLFSNRMPAISLQVREDCRITTKSTETSQMEIMPCGLVELLKNWRKYHLEENFIFLNFLVHKRWYKGATCSARQRFWGCPKNIKKKKKGVLIKNFGQKEKILEFFGKFRKATWFWIPKNRIGFNF